MLNGIEEVVSRADLLDRSLLVLLPEIKKGRRRPEKALWADFESARPAILGALLDVVSVALANERTVRLDGYPRMADFAAWIVAAEPALPWQPGAFLTAYYANQESANDVTLEASPVAQALRDFMKERTEPWIGTATELLGELESVVKEKTTKQKTWPGSGQTLSNDLRRLASNLEAVGIAITFGLKIKGRRALRIEQTEHVEHEASEVSQVSNSASQHGKPGDTYDDQVSPHEPQVSPQASSGDEENPTQRSENPGDEDTWDTWDASSHTHSDLGDSPESDGAGYGQASFDPSTADVPTCQACGAVIGSGVYCDACDPHTS
jgi:hypothetical protein